MTLEESLRAQTKLCTNPHHDYKRWGYFISWQWANDYWQETKESCVVKVHVRFDTLVQGDTKSRHLTIGKFNIYWSRIKS